MKILMGVFVSLYACRKEEGRLISRERFSVILEATRKVGEIEDSGRSYVNHLCDSRLQ